MPIVGDAQEPTTGSRIGFLGGESPSTNHHFVEAFRQGMRDLGYIEGKTFVVDERWGEGRNERLPDLVAELVGLKVNVIVAVSTPAAIAAKNGATIPSSLSPAKRSRRGSFPVSRDQAKMRRGYRSHSVKSF